MHPNYCCEQGVKISTLWCFHETWTSSQYTVFSFTKQLVIYFTVSSKVIHSTVITGTVPVEQPGVRCFAQGHNQGLNWGWIDEKCFQFNGKKKIKK